MFHFRHEDRRVCRRLGLAGALLLPLILIGSAKADMISLGPNGIDAAALHNAGLFGNGVGVGQVELNRPAVPTFDNAANSHPQVGPTGVFVRDQIALPNTDLDQHAMNVASVMIWKSAAHTGVARDATHYASAYVTAGTDPGYQHALLAVQQVASIRGVRAVNNSWGKPLAGGATLNGQSLLARGMDWLTSRHDVAMVVAFDNPGNLNIPVPTDLFNGMVVYRSQRDGAGVYRQIESGALGAGAFFTPTADGRRRIDLIAPGVGITMASPGGGTNVDTGASFAAPHVTGTVALLQEHATNRINAGAANYDATARRHEVMKAVVMNSADKIRNILGSNRTILRTDGRDWVQQRAHEVTNLGIDRDRHPLDTQMGTGHLNARAARTQLDGGKHGPGNIPLIGWDFNSSVGLGNNNVYTFTDAFRKGGHVAITLAWDRLIGLTDNVGDNGAFDDGDAFTADGLADLDLYLVEVGENPFTDAVARSTSVLYSVEHIFFEIETPGNYEFWMRHAAGIAPAQDYGLAWSAVIPEPHTAVLVVITVGWLVRRRPQVA